ncbi:hypothetical protein [Phytoactinopolyspora mesophila]|uniref:RHS repeat protein n=1 Tax=Phytoactinopolyspora mesophila TaxID=2650750 RepID=A0A7K3LZY5_9ACTN|nr:hypothetical protein [Phytoactinopolyspora mesophila]NDL56232.1 hypothetical protein [Phytoactinopolyspora mesophila]
MDEITYDAQGNRVAVKTFRSGMGITRKLSWDINAALPLLTAVDDVTGDSFYRYDPQGNPSAGVLDGEEAAIFAFGWSRFCSADGAALPRAHPKNRSKQRKQAMWQLRRLQERLCVELILVRARHLDLELTVTGRPGAVRLRSACQHALHVGLTSPSFVPNLRRKAARKARLSTHGLAPGARTSWPTPTQVTRTRRRTASPSSQPFFDLNSRRQGRQDR